MKESGSYVKRAGEGKFTAKCELIEAGTGTELAHLIEDADFLIIIDAVNAEASPVNFSLPSKDITIMPEQFKCLFIRLEYWKHCRLSIFSGTVRPQ